MRKCVLASALLLIAVSTAAQTRPASSVDARLAAQNKLFEEFWEKNLELSPTQATAVGDYRYNDKLGDYTLAAAENRHKLNAAFLARIKAISAEGFSEEERTSPDLFLRNLQENL